MLLQRIAFGAVVALALAACSEQPTAPRKGPDHPSATLTSGRTAIHRLLLSDSNHIDHLYSTYANEGTSGTPAYTLENYEYFFIEPAATSGHVALYRCWRAYYSSGDHWLSTDPLCEGYYVIAPQGPQGYIATTQLTGTVPLYRQYNALLDDTFHTTSLSEAQYAEANYNYSTPELMGYVYTEE